MAVLSTDVHAQTTDFHRWIITTMLTMREWTSNTPPCCLVGLWKRNTVVRQREKGHCHILILYDICQHTAWHLARGNRWGHPLRNQTVWKCVPVLDVRFSFPFGLQLESKCKQRLDKWRALSHTCLLLSRSLLLLFHLGYELVSIVTFQYRCWFNRFCHNLSVFTVQR